MTWTVKEMKEFGVIDISHIWVRLRSEVRYGQSMIYGSEKVKLVLI